MSEAADLFDKSGGAASGNKQDAVNGAAMTVMKLLVQSKFSSAIGSGQSGGLGSLMSLVRFFFLLDIKARVISSSLRSAGFAIYKVII